MMQHCFGIVIGALLILAALQQFRIYRIRRDSARREELFQIVTENAADMIALVDMKGNRLYNSPAYKRILGYSAAELGETSAFEQIHPDDRFKVLAAAREARETGAGRKMEYRIRHKNGTWRILESSASTIRDKNGDVAKLVIVNRDITDRKRAEEQLEHNSIHDALTGLPNRRLFLDRLERSFLRSRRNSGSHYVVVLADVDGFKALNDTMGNAAGDYLLAQIGRRLELCLRQDDTLARPENKSTAADAVLSRLGGDEFALLLDGIADPSDAMRVARRIQTATSEHLLVEGHEVRPSLSMGIALSDASHQRAEALLQDAEVALSRAKALGGTRCELFDETMHAQAVNRLALENDLRMAVDRHQFCVFYQPVVKLSTQQTIGFEALLRWQHPAQGMISPYQFLDAAEDTGLSVYIGHWLVVQASRQLRDWQTRNPCSESLQVTMNLSSRQFTDSRLIHDIQAAIHEAGIDPRQLKLEMTESVVLADPKLTISVLSQLKHLGVGAVLDDFGAEHSALRCLRQFPVEALKIDRSLVGEMLSDRSTGDIVEAVIALAHKMNLKVIAKGIETPKQAKRLRELGCDFGQGFLFSQPVEAGEAESFLRSQSGRAASCN
jgi:diguanylate cyclase (GGDEF)-like protein/PAS domain S-box-containing protein